MAATNHNGHKSSGYMPGKTLFLVFSLVVFGATLMVLASYDLLPDSSQGLVPPPSGSQALSTTSTVLPEKILIPKLKLSAVVANPTTLDADVLDQNLLRGAVRYPSSGALGANGQN